MAKDIQIRYINEQKEWEKLYPISKTRLILNESGQTLNELLERKQNKNESYTSLEIDNKLTTINEKIDNLKSFDIPVSATEPTDDSKFWFELI